MPTNDPPRPPGTPQRLLIADNDEILRHSLGLMFTSVGYEVHHAANGRRALEIHRHNPADVVIAEMIMPDTDGVELLMNLGKSGERPKFIAITGGGRMGAGHYLRTATQLGAHRVLAKPFDPEQLLAYVHELIGKL